MGGWPVKLGIMLNSASVKAGAWLSLAKCCKVDFENILSYALKQARVTFIIVNFGKGKIQIQVEAELCQVQV